MLFCFILLKKKKKKTIGSSKKKFYFSGFVGEPTITASPESVNIRNDNSRFKQGCNSRVWLLFSVCLQYLTSLSVGLVDYYVIKFCHLLCSTHKTFDIISAAHGLLQWHC